MNKPKILIVDDDARISGLMHAILEKKGNYEVREENRSFAALATAREFQPDLILMDVDMPGKDGGEVAVEMATDMHLSTTPILFVTSLVSRSATASGSTIIGGRQFLAKPVDPMSLLLTVRNLLGKVAAC